ncbi:MAG: YceI family protein [Gemmobacter sp.]
MNARNTIAARFGGQATALTLVAALAVPATMAQAEPRALEVDLEHTSVHWSIGHGGFSQIVGQFRQINGVTVTFDPDNVANSSVSAVIEAASLDSNHYFRDNYTRSPAFLDVINHPRITFTSTAVAKTGDMTGTMTGDLTLRGETRPVTFDVTYNGTGPHLSGRYQIDGFTARTTITRADFGITAFSPWVGDTVDISIQIEGIHSRQ